MSDIFQEVASFKAMRIDILRSEGHTDDEGISKANLKEKNER